MDSQSPDQKHDGRAGEIVAASEPSVSRRSLLKGAAVGTSLGALSSLALPSGVAAAEQG